MNLSSMMSVSTDAPAIHLSTGANGIGAISKVLRSVSFIWISDLSTYFRSQFTIFLQIYSLRINMFFPDRQLGCVKWFSGRFLLCSTYNLVYVLLFCRDLCLKFCLLIIAHLFREQVKLKFIRI